MWITDVVEMKLGCQGMGIGVGMCTLSEMEGRKMAGQQPSNSFILQRTTTDAVSPH